MKREKDMGSQGDIYARIRSIGADEVVYFPLSQWASVRSCASKIASTSINPRKTYATRRVDDTVAVFRTDVEISNPEIKALVSNDPVRKADSVRASLRKIGAGEAKTFNFSHAETIRQTIWQLRRQFGTEYSATITVTRNR